MHPKLSIGLGLFVTVIMISLASAPSGIAAPARADDTERCLDQGSFPPAVLDVPANGTATFGLADLLRDSPLAMECLEMAAIDASSFVAHAGEGSVSVIPGVMAPVAGWSATAFAESVQQFTFTARPGFSGVSQGWEFVLYGRDDAGKPLRIGIVQATFQVRNTVPVAKDDSVVVNARLGKTCVDVDGGVLANDVDANGDPVIVYSEGVTSYSWGMVEMHRDGSYRVTVTDPQVTGTEQVRYVIWDQVGSTTSTDTGILTLTFTNGLASNGSMAPGDAPEDGCGDA